MFLLTFMVSKRVNLYPVFTNDVRLWMIWGGGFLRGGRAVEVSYDGISIISK